MLLDGKFSQNSHVMSYWKKCDMCHIRYDIIGKMETFNKGNLLKGIDNKIGRT